MNHKDKKPLSVANGYWNGEPAIYTACVVQIVRNDASPMHWYNAFVGTYRQAIQISQNGHSFVIDNETGTGHYKVTKGMGSPGCGHADSAPCLFISYIDKQFWVDEINEAKIKIERIEVDAYQQATNPAEFQRIKYLEAHMENFPTGKSFASAYMDEVKPSKKKK